MKIKNIIISLPLLLVMSLLVLTIRMFNVQTMLFDAEKKHETYRYLASELRLTSFELTRHARTYVLTGDKKYKDEYFSILAVKNGEKPRPQNSEIAPGEKIPIHNLFEHNGLKQEEHTLLHEADDNTNALNSIEREAINAMNGLNKDASGPYEGAENPKAFAVRILFDDDYHEIRDRIEEPLEHFNILLKNRTSNTLEKYTQSAHNYLIAILTNILLLIFFGLIAIATYSRGARERKQSEKELFLVFENVPLPMIVVDQNRKVTKANRAMRTMGGEERDVLGLGGGDAMLCIYRLDSPQGCGYGTECKNCGLKSMVIDTLANNIHHLREEQTVFVNSREDSIMLTVLASSVPINISGIIHALVIVEDITHQRYMEDEKDKLQSQLLQSQKMEAIGHLSGGVAHDFNNMLAVINGCTQLAMMDTNSNTDAYSELTTILDTLQRAKELSMKLLSFARKDVPEVKAVRPETLINEVVSLIKRTTPKKIEISVKIEEGLPSIYADAKQVQQALINICNNSVDAMEGKGTLTIMVEEASGKEPGLLPPGNYCRITISDTGHGISKENLRKIFDPFFTTKVSGKGTGLGLSVTHGIILNNKGSINAESTPSTGTTFTILLPSTKDNIAILSIDDSNQYAGKDNECILLIDDEEIILRTTERLLSKMNYKTLSAQDGMEAIEIYRKHKDEISVVLLDFLMPKVDAWDVYGMLKEINPDVKVIIASGYSRENTLDTFKSAGIKDFIQKPFLLMDLCRSIRAVIES